MRKAWIAGAALAALWAWPAAPRADDVVHLGKAVGVAWTFLAADVGVAEGIYKKYGLDVEISSFGGDAKLQQAMAAGAVDFGLGSGPAMAFAVKGAPVIAVAAFGDQPSDISIVLPADSPIKSVKDLKGKLLAVSTTGSLTDWLVKRVSSSEGWGTDGIRTAALGDAPSQVAAMRAHEVDGLMGSTDYSFQLEERHEGRQLVGMGTFVPHFIAHVVFARRDLVKEKPDVVRRFLKGFFASIAFIRDHKAETIKIAEPIQHESPAVLSRAQDYEMPMLRLDGVFDPEGLKLIKQSFVDMHILDREPPDDAILTRAFVPVTP
jgi:ABC-type nitrate/sulfonate/bicarbonate transport system substrate-binding protein